jgi:hypothetical protein
MGGPGNHVHGHELLRLFPFGLPQGLCVLQQPAHSSGVTGGNLVVEKIIGNMLHDAAVNFVVC